MMDVYFSLPLVGNVRRLDCLTSVHLSTIQCDLQVVVCLLSASTVLT
jgi:hypothetical protein